MELGEYRHRAKTGKWPDHSERRIGRNNSNSHETNVEIALGATHTSALYNSPSHGTISQSTLA